MSRIVIANCNPSLNKAQEELVSRYDAVGIKKKEELNLKYLERLNPEYIFFMHWSWIISEAIFKKYACVVFHMTDLPYGRGGSPLQNLIIRGHRDTKISAIKVDSGVDTGDIYLKKDLSLAGKASEIFKRTGRIIQEMIDEIISYRILPSKQDGAVTIFERRKPAQSLIDNGITDVEKLYDFIRMLDAENYPHAYLETDSFKFDFTNAEMSGNQEIVANVRIIKK